MTISYTKFGWILVMKKDRTMMMTHRIRVADVAEDEAVVGGAADEAAVVVLRVAHVARLAAFMSSSRLPSV